MTTASNLGHGKMEERVQAILIPRFDHLLNHPGQPRGGRGFTAAFRDLQVYVEERGLIMSDLEFLATIRDNPDLRWDLRMAASAARLPFERRLAARPHVPDFLLSISFPTSRPFPLSSRPYAR